MKKEYLDPFLEATKVISEEMLREEIQNSHITREKSLSMDSDIVVAIAIKKDLNGIVLFGFKKDEALKFANKFVTNMGGFPYEEWGDDAESALLEFANILAGRATEYYGNEGFDCALSTPTITNSDQFKSLIQESIRFQVDNSVGQLLVKLHIKKS